jgi:putative CocE/NonD family hydrolase
MRVPGQGLIVAFVCAAVVLGGVACTQEERGDRTASVPMRDGVRLATDLYFPAGSGEPWPVILVRTPYKKERYAEYSSMFTTHGYVVAVQDVRGRFGSEGQWVPFVHEGPDGFDAVEWLAAQKWSTGKVGMVGSSYDGFVQFAAAVEKPPHLVTIVPNLALADMFTHFPYQYGVFWLQSLIWADIVESEATADMSGQALEAIRDKDWLTLLDHLPVVDLDEKVLGREIGYYREWIEHSTKDSYWAQGSSLEKIRALDLPVFLQSGWFDEATIGTKLAYLALAKSGNEHVKLIIGPWGHTPFAESHYRGEFMGQAAQIDLVALRVRWFDHWLKGIDSGILDEPLVQLYATGSDKWLYADTYPLPETELTALYLSSEQGALPQDGGGHLSWELRSNSTEFDAYIYDPSEPTPGPFGDLQDDPPGYGRALAQRGDVLVYETAPFEKPVTVVGPISTILYASSSAKDTDWFITLYQVSARGALSRYITRGMIRARFRDSLERPELLEQDEVYRYTLDLGHTGRTFEAGSRLRMIVSSALHPLYSRNLNTGGRNELETKYVVARQRVYHSAEYPSHLSLPVVRISR